MLLHSVNIFFYNKSNGVSREASTILLENRVFSDPSGSQSSHKKHLNYLPNSVRNATNIYLYVIPEIIICIGAGDCNFNTKYFK